MAVLGLLRVCEMEWIECGKVWAWDGDKYRQVDKAELLFICTLGLGSFHHVHARGKYLLHTVCTHSHLAIPVSFPLWFILQMWKYRGYDQEIKISRFSLHIYSCNYFL